MVHELNMQLRWPRIGDWIMLFQLTVSRPHAEIAEAVAWLGMCLHICGVAIGLSLRAIAHHCCAWMRAQEWGSTARAWLQCKRQATFCLAAEDLDFAPPKELNISCLLPLSSVTSWAWSPPYGKTQMSSGALHTPRGEASTLQLLHCSGFVWSPTCIVTRSRSLIAHPDQTGAEHVFHPSQGGDINFATKGTFYNRELP